MTADDIRSLARDCGLELAGVTPALPAEDRARYHRWVDAGFAGEMRYLTDRRELVRDDPRNLLATARSVICVGKVYDTPCHRILGHAVDLPNSDWVAENHWCVPLYYRPVSDPISELSAR